MGYDPQLAAELHALHHPDSRHSNLNKLARTRERAILTIIGDAVKAQLDQHRLAPGGLPEAIAGRRVDIVLPSEVPYSWPLDYSLGTLAGFAAKYAIHTVLWAPGARAGESVTALTPERSISAAHPLSRSGFDMPANLIDHTITTSAGTKLSTIAESATYEACPPSAKLTTMSKGFGLMVRRIERRVLTANYDVPRGANVATVARPFVSRLIDPAENPAWQRYLT